MRFANKTALVTGAYRGIGFATAKLFAQEGANVVVNARHKDKLEEAVKEIQAVAKGGSVIGYLADVSDHRQVNAMFDRIYDELGRCDYLVNNAAIDDSEPFLTASDEWWHSHMSVNLDSAFFACQRAARGMIERGEGGSIVNLSSIAATQAHRNSVAYDTTKGGIEAFTRALALEVAPWNIRVNAISPAAVVGFFVKQRDEQELKERPLEKFDTPLPMQGTPEDCANLICFLCSEEARFITGQAVYIDGGLSAQCRPYCMSPLMLNPSNFEQKGWKF
ncbi:MAG: SDR family NAD(P)-dependent oxidoreductase [Clostridia bacterium]